MQLASLVAAGTLAYVVIVLYRVANGERATRREWVVWGCALLVGLGLALGPLLFR